MIQKLTESEEKDDTGYYTPKNILNPAMFRLAEITRALSEVNMKVDQEKLFDERRHTINIEEHNLEEKNHEVEKDSFEAIEVIEGGKRKAQRWTDTLSQYEDQIGKTLIISLAISIFLLILMLIFSI
uniref:Uncharacterized protein n=1 Tax=Caenorhabditis tropicalis TaxID=1561998 RepID=A0A1I7U3B1_9PELO